MTSDTPKTDQDVLQAFLSHIMFRASVTRADIEDKGMKVLVNPNEIPEGLSQDVSDVTWIYISEQVTAGYVLVYNKKNLADFWNKT